MGAMGCVYRVRHSVLEHEHAMKILYGDLGQDFRLVERFKREAKAISKMRHPNVVSVSDFGRTENGLIFLVMEYVPGPTLHDELGRRGPMPPDRVARIMAEIAAGLGEAHRMGYVHRDVKPTNIVLSSDEGEETIKILDFGIVGLRVEPLDARLTNMGFLVGTPTYMAPEQATDPSHVTPAADLYSLGVIAFELLAGRPPFMAPDPLDVIIAHSTQPVPAVPPASGLETLVAWMLKKRAGDRPQSSEQVLAELSHLQLVDSCDISRGSGGAIPQDFDIPLLDPITYVGNQQLKPRYEDLRHRVDRLQEILLRAPWGSNARTLFEGRLLELSASVTRGLVDDGYRDLSERIGELEDELLEVVRFWPA